MPYNMINPVGAPPPQQPQLQGYAPMNPIQGAIQEGPPTTPQELEQRKSGWQEFMTKLQTDPAMRQAAMMAATTMMRGPGMGEDTGELLGRSLQSGVIAHGFNKANQTRMDLERQKMEQERALNQAQIAQQQAQTSGLQQSQEFARADRPMDVRSKQQGIDLGDQRHKLGTYTLSGAEFEEKNRPAAFKATQRKLGAEALKDEEHAGYMRRGRQDAELDANGNPIPGTGKEPLSAKDLHIQKTIKRANPREEGETPEQYDQRLANIELGRDDKSMDAVVVQSAQHIIANTDPGTPEHTRAVQALDAVIARQGKGAKGAKGASDKAAWAKARDSVPIGQKYTGPDGKTYVRGN